MGIVLEAHERLEASRESGNDIEESVRAQMQAAVQTAFKFAFKMHQFAGGFDQASTDLFAKLKAVLTPSAI